MDAFMNMETNPIVKILGQESDIDHVNDVVGFLFVLSVARSCRGSYVTKMLRTLIRAYAALAFVMPLMLGGLPSGMMKDIDHYAMLVFWAMMFDYVPLGKIHPFLDDAVDRLAGLSYCIVKANACAAGYHAFGKAFAGSMAAPFLGAFVATNGHQFIEKGMGAFDLTLKGNKDNKVAVCGGLVLYTLETQMHTSGLVAKATLAGLNCAQDNVDFDGMIASVTKIVDGVVASLTGVIGGGSKKMMSMKRSATPKRK